MTDTNSDLLPQGIRDAIGKAAELNPSNTVLHDQKSHPQLMREGMFKAASSYAGNYRKDHPSAAGLLTRIETLAYKPKPADYPQFIDRLVESWLSGSTTGTETNAATVQRIRDRFPNDSFASNLLNKPLSKFKFGKLAALATAKGYGLDTRRHNTLAKIKAAARNGELGKVQAGSGIISINVPYSPSHLGQFKIEQHGQQDTIRFRRPDGTRRRIAVADLQALAELFAEAGPEEGLLSSLKRIGNWDQNPANPQKPVKPLLTDAIELENIPVIWDQIPVIGDQDTRNPAETLDSYGEIVSGNLGPNDIGTSPEPNMTERIAALSAYCSPRDTTTYPADYDPLCHD